MLTISYIALLRPQLEHKFCVKHTDHDSPLRSSLFELVPGLKITLNLDRRLNFLYLPLNHHRYDLEYPRRRLPGALDVI